MIRTCDTGCRSVGQTRRVGGDKSLFENIAGQTGCDNGVNAALYGKSNGTPHFPPLASRQHVVSEGVFDENTSSFIIIFPTSFGRPIRMTFPPVDVFVKRVCMSSESDLHNSEDESLLQTMKTLGKNYEPTPNFHR